jgi:hypothetical protein
LAILVLGGSIMLTATQASAGTGCVAGCAYFRKNCLLVLSMDDAGCKVDCKATASDPTCGRACGAAKKAARAACDAAKNACYATCKPLDGTCTAPCGDDAVTCLKPGKDLRSACYPACKAAWAPVYHACADDPCRTTALQDLANCDRGCGDQIEALGCEGPFDDCVAACTP